MALLRGSVYSRIIRQASPRPANYLRNPIFVDGHVLSASKTTWRPLTNHPNPGKTSSPPPSDSKAAPAEDGVSGKATAAARSLNMKERIVDRALKSDGTGVAGSYALYGGTMILHDSIKIAAAYTISAEDRVAERVELLPDGEELGQSKGPWHEAFGLPATFSTWAQVTMLHLYIVVARARCFHPDAYQSFYSQMLEHFFFECETQMDMNHGMGSKALRQRFLKDVFVQWRGLVVAYDEGLVRGDAALASALWRNLYKGREDVDMRAVAGLVAWMRATLWDLERRPDSDIVAGTDLFRLPAQSWLKNVDKEVEKLMGAGR